MKRIIILIFITTSIKATAGSNFISHSMNANDDSILLNVDNFINLRYLNNEKKIKYFNWDSKINFGTGVLENGYTFSISSCYKEEDYWIQATCMKTNDTVDLTKNTKKEYLAYINSQIIYLAQCLFKDTLIVKEFTKAINEDKFELEDQTGYYKLITRGGRYNEVSVGIIHVNYFSNVYVILAKGDDWFAK